jgi:hypothetical protein
VACGIGGLYVVDVLFGPHRKAKLYRLLVLIGVTAIWALMWIGVSRLLSPDFPRAYTEFGAKYGVSESIIVKALRLPSFYERLFHGVVGTYYLPPLRMTLVLFACSALAGTALFALQFARRRYDGAIRIVRPVALLIGTNLGLLLIGKYSQPTAVLLLPGAYWLVAAVLDCLSGGFPGVRSPVSGARLSGKTPGVMVRVLPAAVAVILLTIISIITVKDALHWRSVSYRQYVSRITTYVSPESKVLAGPNTAFAFEPGKLHAFNDLAALEEKNLSFSDYIDHFEIEYILYPDEIDVIYSERPIWNDMYGNVASYYREMRNFIEENCHEIAALLEPVFSMRILRYQKPMASRLTIYRVPDG